MRLKQRSLIATNLAEHLEVVNSLSILCQEAIRDAAVTMIKSLALGKTLFWCGNGGSAADCQHMAAELVGRFKKDRKPLRSIALTTDSSILTCISNDYEYEDIFSRQLNALASEGDVLIVISTSGNSKNVVNALKAAQNLSVSTIALLGKDGGKCTAYSNLSIIVPSNSTARIQEVHILIGHMLCDLIEMELELA